MTFTSLDPATLADQLVDGEELALLDAREQGVFLHSHLFHAACVPLSTLELTMPTLVPRLTTRIVWCDDGESELAERAAARAGELGYDNQSILAGGVAAWEAAGNELYSGVNVPSKAFGEFVEHTYGTPRIPAAELQALLDADTDMVVLDSRPMEEFSRMSIPTGIDCPGAELVHRVKQVAPDPATLVVVNCAGRTRSIIGTQSLLNAGLPNKVVALENGTMGWELAGFDVARGHTTHAPNPDSEAENWALAAAANVAARFSVDSISHEQLDEWIADDARTTFVFDVRTPEEFATGHLAGSVSAPGGQLVQATDEYAGTRNARLVLVDDNSVRATMTASWLRQLGWMDAVVLRGGIAGADLVTGKAARGTGPSGPTISNAELAELLDRTPEDVAVLDIGTSLKYRRKGHIPGAWWGVRSRLDEARRHIGETRRLVLTSTDGQLAKHAVADVQTVWPEAEVLALIGGNKTWRHAGHDMEPGFERATTEANDVWYKPYDHEGEVVEQHMQDYLTWEIALVEQMDRDPTVSFQPYE